MTDYRLVAYDQDCAAQVLSLQSHLWGASSKVRSSYFDWKYSANPYLEQPLAYLALHENRVVGMRGVFGTCWMLGVGRKAQVFPCMADTVIEPAYRDHGLFGELSQFAMDDLSERRYTHALNLSASNANVAASVLAMSWRQLGPVGLMARSTQTGETSSDLVSLINRSSLGSYVLSVAKRLRAASKVSAFSSIDGNYKKAGDCKKFSRISLEKVARPEAMAKLIERLPADTRIRHVRDDVYFAWRFKNPRAEYRFLFVGGGRDLHGYLVLKAAVGGSAVYVVDWESEDPGLKSELLRAAVELGDFPQLSIWSASLSQADMDELQELGFRAPESQGFSQSKEPRVLIKRLIEKDDENYWVVEGIDLQQRDNWDLRMLYSDAA